LSNPEPACLKAAPGSYVLWLRLGSARRVRVGALGSIRFAPGHYAYVGSALGPGGLAARLGRHFRPNKSLRWHVDYLRRVSELRAAWVCYDDSRHEHGWAADLAGLSGARLPVPGFGSSDCSCPSHLIWFERLPPLRQFSSARAGDATGLVIIKRFCE